LASVARLSAEVLWSHVWQLPPSSRPKPASLQRRADCRKAKIIGRHDPRERRGTDRYRIPEDPPSRERLQELIAAMGISVRSLLREKGTPYADLDLGNSKWSDDDLLDFMMAHPILINRPIVVTPIGVRLCRPSEAVLGILPNPAIGRFVKEDGEMVDAREA
jgi:arsenate reductase